ncbi:MAG: sporulation protein YtxC [Bacillaceae bacterium]
MISISFEREQDAVALYNRLTKGVNPLKYINLSLRHNIVEVKGTKGIQTYTSLVFIPTFIRFIMDMFEGKQIIEIVKQDFLFSSEEECLLIYQMFKSIIDDHIFHREKGIGDRKQYLLQMIQDFFMLPISFSYEAFVKFRLKEYKEHLYMMVEKAIDEYKLEQNYQMYIQTIRAYIKKKAIYLKRINIVINEEIKVYDEEFRLIPLEKIPIDMELMKKCNDMIDEKVIAPLLSLSPESIYIYSSSKDEQLILGIYNIFEEKVKWFPYYAYTIERQKFSQIIE